MIRRALVVTGLTGLMGLGLTASAQAQEQPPTNCDPFSCLFVIPIGPFEIVLFPNGLGPPPGTP